MLHRNEHGIAMSYVLMIMVIVGLVVQGLLTKVDTIAKSQENVQRALDASLFARGLGNVLENAQACSNSLGFGYMTATSAANANDFNPLDQPGTSELIQPVIMRDPAGQQSIMHQAFLGAVSETTPPPVTARAFTNAVIRSMYLQRRDGAAAEMGSAVLTRDPLDSSVNLPQPYDMRAVEADLHIVIETYSSTGSTWGKMLKRNIPLTIYAMKPQSSAGGWKVLTCTPHLGQPNLSGWGDGVSRVTVSGFNQANCPPNMYAISLLADRMADNTGYNLTVDCATIAR